MPRVKRSVASKKKRRKILKLAKGYFGARSRLYRIATESVNRSMAFAYRDRKVRKRDFRKLWIARINAAARMNDISYSRLMEGMRKNGLTLDRKVLAHIAVYDAPAFEEIVRTAKGEAKA